MSVKHELKQYLGFTYGTLALLGCVHNVLQTLSWDNPWASVMVSWRRSDGKHTVHKHWAETIPRPHWCYPGVAQMLPVVKRNTNIELRQSLGIIYGTLVSVAQMWITHNTQIELKHTHGLTYDTLVSHSSICIIYELGTIQTCTSHSTKKSSFWGKVNLQELCTNKHVEQGNCQPLSIQSGTSCPQTHPSTNRQQYDGRVQSYWTSNAAECNATQMPPVHLRSCGTSECKQHIIVPLHIQWSGAICGYSSASEAKQHTMRFERTIQSLSCDKPSASLMVQWCRSNAWKTQ